MTDQDVAELLTEDMEASRPTAIPGPVYPVDLRVAKYRTGGENMRVAYLHKFFKRDEHGRGMPETLVRFYVPEHLCHNTQPTRRALELVEQRMGWTTTDTASAETASRDT